MVTHWTPTSKPDEGNAQSYQQMPTGARWIAQTTVEVDGRRLRLANLAALEPRTPMWRIPTGLPGLVVAHMRRDLLAGPPETGRMARPGESDGSA